MGFLFFRMISMGLRLAALRAAGAPLKHWIALKARADWFIKLRISCAIYLRATREKMASRFTSVTSEEMIHFFVCGVYYLTVLVYTKTTIHLSVGG